MNQGVGVDNLEGNMKKGVIIPFPEFDKLKVEIEKLKTEISMLLLEKDELLLVICKNIEMEYMLAVGHLEYKAFELNCKVLRIKRKIDLLQAKKNRQEKILISQIEKILDDEFAEFEVQLEEQINKVNEALSYSHKSFLSDEETKEIKKLYHTIVKALHPDLHPEVTPAQLKLFQNAVEAYENGDLHGLRVINDLVSEPVISEHTENALSALIKDKERFMNTIKMIQEEIASIKSSYPYTLKEILDNPQKLEQKQAELKEIISGLKEVYDIYEARLNEMLR